MKIAIFGASGMVGKGALLECLDDPRVGAVLVVGRSPCGVVNPKLREILHSDFTNFEPLRAEFAGCDACLFCLGTSASGVVGMSFCEPRS